LKGLGDYLRGTFSQDLAAKAKADASHVRGNDKQYGAASLVDGRTDTYWATDDGVTSAEATLNLARPTKFQVIRVKEAIQFGQRIDAVEIERWQPEGWQPLAKATSIGARRLIRLEAPVIAQRLRLRVTQASASPVLSEFALFNESGA
jgi:alpha-L-fucosidase